MCCCAKRIANDEESDIFCLGIVEDVVAGRLDHFSVCDDYFAAIVCLLEDRFVDEENAGVCFEIDSRGFADDVETFDSNVCLV